MALPVTALVNVQQLDALVGLWLSTAHQTANVK